MHIHRYNALGALALASSALLLGSDIYAKDEAGQNLQFVSKSHERRLGKSSDALYGHEGERGHRGNRGKHGHRGVMGPDGLPGPTGATGAVGPSGFLLTGTATGAQSGTPFYATAGDISLPAPNLILMPLTMGTPTSPSSGSPFSFTAYDGTADPASASYTINQAGTYLLQYGLVGVPNLSLVNNFLANSPSPQALCAICIQINQGGKGTNLTQIGMVPLTLTWTLNSMPSAPTGWILSGYGQIYQPLQPKDVVTLQLLLAAPSPSVNSQQLLIGPTSITYTGPASALAPISVGPMLSITQIAN